MIEAVKYQLAHLADFTGRDGRSAFWYWMLFLVVMDFVVGILISIPMTALAMGTAFDAARAGGSQAEMQAQMMSSVSANVGMMVYVSQGLIVVATLLFIAAFVRRLHDSGRSGWWVVVPLATQVVGIYLSLRTASEMAAMMSAASPPDLQAMGEMASFGLVSLVPYVGYVLVIVLGALPSEPGPNRYGEAPVSF